MTLNHWRIFWLNIVKNGVYLWYQYYSNLFRKMRREANFGNIIAEILRKIRREEREMMWLKWEREKGILAIILPKYVPQKTQLTYLILETDIRDCIDQNEKKKKKLNCDKSNAMTINYFNIFLQIVVIFNFLLILIKTHQ